jgi:hypothetical protein
MLNAAMLHTSLDLLSSARLDDVATHLISDLTTDISILLTDSDLGNTQAVRVNAGSTRSGPGTLTKSSTLLQRLREQELERQLQDIRWLAAESGFDLGYPELNDTTSTFEAQLRQEPGHGLEAFGRGDPM